MLLRHNFVTTSAERHWQFVSAALNQLGFKRRDGRLLDWATIQVLAENHGITKRVGVDKAAAEVAKLLMPD